MKRILCLMFSVLLLLSAVLVLPSCAGKVKRTADYVKGDEVVIDNETPFSYNEGSVKYYYGKMVSTTMKMTYQ
jgi:hypothetical protein